MIRFVPMVWLAACGVSEERVQELIAQSNGGGGGENPDDTPSGGVSAADLDALRLELEEYADAAALAAAADAVAGLGGVGGPIDAGDLTGTVDPDALPEIPVDHAPVRTRIVQLGVYGSAFGAETGAFGNSGIAMPDNGELAHGFVVPPDYTSGDPLDLHVVWRASEASCTFDLRGNFNDVVRVGATPYSGNAAGGLGTQGLLTAPAVPEEATETVIALTDPNGAALQPLDTVNFGLYRNGGSCVSVSIAGMYVAYDAR